MDRILTVAARGLAYAAAACLAAMMLLTVADVVLRATISLPVRGVTEIIELLLACAFFIALPAVFVRDENLVVDTIDGIAPGWVNRLRRLGGLFAALLLAAMAWQGWIAARDTLEFGDLTADLSMPRIIYWVPVLVGIVAAAIASVILALRASGRLDPDSTR